MNFYFFCSPSLGILDCWLPIIWNLKRCYPKVNIIFVFPKHSTLKQLKTNNLLLELASPLVHKVIYKSFFGTWHSCSSLASAQSAYSILYDFQILRRVSEFLHFRVPYILPDIVNNFCMTIFSAFSFHRFLNKSSWTKNILLYDVYEETKSYYRNFFDSDFFDFKFSMFHGVDIHIVPLKPTEYHINATNLHVFAYSHAELDYYTQYLRLSPSVLSVVGIPRHDSNWIKKIISTNIYPKAYPRATVLFTRPENNYLPRQRKLELLKSIKYVLQKYDIHLFVKLHPKEHDHAIYTNAFGSDDSQFSWSFTNLHPFSLSRVIDFAIVFFSNICIDMTALSVPTLQYLDLSDLTCSNLLEPQTYSSHGLVKLLSTPYDLDIEVSNILNGNHEILTASKHKYDELFPCQPEILNKITKSILTEWPCYGKLR